MGMENIYLFKGTEELIIHNKIDNIIKNAKVPSFNKTIYDLDVASLSDAISDCLTIPFMSKTKIVIIRNPRFLEKLNLISDNAQKYFMQYLKKPNLDCILIIDATNIKVDEKTDLYKLIEHVGHVDDTRVLTDIEMKGWLTRQFGINGIEISSEAVDLFFEYVGTNLVKGKTEIEKLVNYLGSKKEVTIDDIKNVVSDDGETDIFELTKAINTKNKALVHKKYNELIKNGFDQIQLMNLIYRNFKDMYLVLTLLESGKNKNEIASFMGVSPGRAYYLMKDVASYNMESVKKTLFNITELDYKIKTGKIDKATGLDLLLFGMN